MRISKEINEFFCGKDESSQPAKAALASPGVSEAGVDVLAQRGNLPAEEIMRRAHKGKKAACHSDNVADGERAKLVQIDVMKAVGVKVNESGL